MPERHRILIVDDDALDRAAVVRALRHEAAALDGVEADVLEVDTVTAAREALRREEFACVFLDHHLPDGTSLDLLMEVRSQGLATPVVVLTGQRDEQAIVEVMKAGAVDYLPKERLHPDLIARSLRAALRFLQAEREKQSALEDLRARDRAIAAATNGIVIADPRQPDCPIVYVNDAFLRMTGYAREEVLGRNCRFLQGPETDPVAARALGEAILAERPCQTLILNYAKDGRPFWNEVTVSPVRDVQGRLTHFVGVQTDVTDRHQAEGERRRVENELRRFQFLVENASDALFLLDEAGCFLYVNAAACRSLGYRADEMLRMRADDVDPFFDAAAYQALFRRLEDEPLPPFESRHRRKDGTTFSIEASVTRLDIGGQPLLFSSARDISERKQIEREREAAAQALQEAHARTAAILGSITDAFIALDKEWRFTYINDQAERVVFQRRDEVLGRVFWDVFPATVGSTFERMYRRAVDEGVTVAFEEFFPPLDTWFEVRAYPSAEGLSIFFQNVNARRRAAEERERLLAEQQAVAEREALLNRIGQALRSSEEPAQVLETAVRELGQALGADRCYYAAYDQEADTAVIGHDWHRDDLPELTGQYPMSRFVVNRDPDYKAGRTQVVADTADDPAAQALGLRALVRVPLVSGRAMTALSVAMARGPRTWTDAEVDLVEAVATQTQTALEAVRLQHREHAIAQQLQDALQPALPRRVPGLSLGRFTLPALDEARVGGDFYDVFPLNEECYALVIGDVSGKGLAAAQQLALIRNSLRTTLYLAQDPAQAAANLNRIVTLHDLLAGFVTLWVGVYDAATGRIAYCSCGHEPALVRRVGGLVEILETTGPPLGVSENAAYTGGTFTLTAGDALLLYTDGLSESGLNRREMLGAEGLTRLFLGLSPEAHAQAQAEALVEQARALAGGTPFRDDVAVLLARRQ